MSTHEPKVLVIGLDGGNLEVFRRLAHDGHMPFVKSVLDNGVSGTLQSTIPPATPPAWSTFMTGKNPGKHGIYSFFNYEDSITPPRPINSRSLKSETLWSLLSRAGKRMGVVNVPITYPPQKVNGVMITGLLTPSVEQTFTYPESLYSELRDELGEYIIHVPWRNFARHRTLDYLEALQHCTHQRAKYVSHLMRHWPWDFFMVVFTEIDSLQHRCWSFLDPGDRRESNAEIERKVFEYFRHLDERLRELCELAGPNTNVFFVSDHGFGTHEKQFHINTWLNGLGLLSFDRTSVLKSRLKWRLRELLRFVDRYNWRRRFSSAEIRQLNVASWIRWDRTKAYSYLTGEQGIRINLKGREPCGIVEPGEEYEQLRNLIIEKIQSLRDPASGETIQHYVKRREEVYDGPYCEHAPDIVFLLADVRWCANVTPLKSLMLDSTFWHGRGDHRLHGLLFANGPGVRQNATVERARIEDLFPTILYTLGESIPAGLDGRVLTELFNDDFASRRTIKTSDATRFDETRKEDAYSESEEKAVLDRLRGLGYID